MANLFKKENRFYNKIKLAFYIVEDVKDELDARTSAHNLSVWGGWSREELAPTSYLQNDFSKNIE